MASVSVSVVLEVSHIPDSALKLHRCIGAYQTPSDVVATVGNLAEIIRRLKQALQLKVGWGRQWDSAVIAPNMS